MYARKFFVLFYSSTAESNQKCVISTPVDFDTLDPDAPYIFFAFSMFLNTFSFNCDIFASNRRNLLLQVLCLL